MPYIPIHSNAIVDVGVYCGEHEHEHEDDNDDDIDCCRVDAMLFTHRSCSVAQIDAIEIQMDHKKAMQMEITFWLQLFYYLL